MEAEEPCIPTAQQLHAVARAIISAKQLHLLKQTLNNPCCVFSFIFTVFSVILRHIPYEFIQLYIRDVASGVNCEDLTPLFTGGHAGVVMLVFQSSLLLGTLFGLLGMVILFVCVP